MSPIDTKSVKFGNPPIIELVMGVDFSPLSKIKVSDIGELWRKFPEYSETEDHEPLSTVLENTPFESRPTTVRVPNKSDLPRVWYKSQDGKLVQFQSDRFLFNWRRTGSEHTVYPGYQTCKDEFVLSIDKLKEFLSSKNENVKIQQCELTYIDIIHKNDVWENHNELHRIVNVINPISNLAVELEQGQLNLRFAIKNKENDSIGRIHLSIFPAFIRKTGEKVFQMETVARSYPFSMLDDNITNDFSLNWFDVARAQISEVFLRLTTPEIQQSWGPVYD